MSPASPPMQAIATERLVLEPLMREHADAMFEVLADPALHRYLDDRPPPSVDDLRGRYVGLESRRSLDGSQLWLNWVVRLRDGAPIGFVQATVIGKGTAWIAYLLARAHQGRGHARAATQAMLAELAHSFAVRKCLATVEVENRASIRLLETLGFHSATPRELRPHRLTPTERLFVGAPGNAQNADRDDAASVPSDRPSR